MAHIGVTTPGFWAHTILARWWSASWEVTGSALGGNTPSETPGIMTLAFIRARVLLWKCMSTQKPTIHS